ncbi:response regulator transcription factor [Ilumatobacter sp.]|uniref:response regulator transcription factor n=1 Tax=Ilumatobacter sp. TaxID=1967498 RepID=UPI003C5D3B92
MPTVHLIEDDDQIADSLAKVLRAAGHVVSRSASALDGLSRLVDDRPEVIVLDLGLPDLDGLDAIKMIRGYGEVPIIVATARDDESTIVRALDLGADDYVVKPFSGKQLDARIRALLRRGGTASALTFTIGDLQVDLAAREVTAAGEPVELRRKEFDLLALLASRAGQVVTRREIAQEVWDDPLSSSDSTIDVHVSSLRRRLGESADEPRYLRVVRGVGMKLVEPDSP